MGSHSADDDSDSSYNAIGNWLQDMFSFLKGGQENPYYYSKTQRTWDEVLFAGMLVGGGLLAGGVLYHLLTGGRGLDLANIRIPGIHTPLFGPAQPAAAPPPLDIPSAVGGAPPGPAYPPIAPTSPPQVIPQIPGFTPQPPIVGAAYANPPPPPPEPRPDSAFLATYRTQPDPARTSISYPTYYYYYPVKAPSPMYPSKLSGDIAGDYAIDYGRSQVFNEEKWSLERDMDGNLSNITVHRNVRET